jgi:hypothetical protein
MSSAELIKAYMGPRRDMKTTGASRSAREDLIAGANGKLLKRAERARMASCSVTGSGGGESAPASDAKGSLRDEIRASMER